MSLFSPFQFLSSAFPTFGVWLIQIRIISGSHEVGREELDVNWSPVRQSVSDGGYGVNPGGLAEGGESINDAYWNFRNDYTKVLYDIAEDARNFDEFRLEVIRFFEDTNLPTLKEWGSGCPRCSRWSRRV